jgi:hypothetical protein
MENVSIASELANIHRRRGIASKLNSDKREKVFPPPLNLGFVITTMSTCSSTGTTKGLYENNEKIETFKDNR